MTPKNQGAKELKKFLNLLFEPDDLVELRCIETWTEEDNKKRSNISKRCYYKTKELYSKPVLKELQGVNSDDNAANIFFGVCPRPAEGKGKSEDIEIVRVLWADLDDCKVKEAVERCEKSTLPTPSIVLNSGHGAHLYWLLKEPVAIQNQEDRIKMQATLKALQETISGDHTQDLARLLRLPGFLNVKDARNGANPTPCTVTLMDKEHKYSLSEFPQPTLETKPVEVRSLAQVPPVDKKKTKEITKPLEPLLNKKPGERSEADFRVCCELIREGVKKETAWEHLKGKSKFAERNKSYFDSTWEAALKQVAKDAPSLLPKSIAILGVDDAGNTIIWSKDIRRLWSIKKLKDLDRPTLIQICGKSSMPRGEEIKTDKVHLLLQDIVAEKSRRRMFKTENYLGQGVWKKEGIEGTLVLSGDEALLIKTEGGKLVFEKITSPILQGKLLEFDPSQSWADLSEVELQAKSIDKRSTKKLWNQLTEHLSFWNFELDIDLEIVTAMILATSIQGTLDFRPHVWLTGGTNTGKTALMEFISRLWPHALRYENETSEAALRQSIRRSCLPVLYDECESWHGRSRVIKLLRSATRGNIVVKGTPGQKPIKYGLRHIFWLASIETGLRAQADINRFITIELLTTENIQIADRSLLKEFGQKLIIAAITLVNQIKRIYGKLTVSPEVRKYNRFGESLSLPAAVKAAFLGCPEKALEFFQEFMSTRKEDFKELSEPDYTKLIADICSSKIIIEDQGSDSFAKIPYLIGDLIKEGKGINELNQHGIRILNDTEIYLCPSVIEKNLLKNSQWKDSTTKDIIKRIPGAERRRMRVAGYNNRGYVVPVKVFGINEDKLPF